MQDHQLREPGLKIDFSDPACVGLMLGSVSFSKTAQNVNNEIGNEKCLRKGRCCGLRRSLQRKNKDKNNENQKQEIAHLPHVGSEIGEKVSKGAMVGADDDLHKDAPQYTPQPSELETITKLS